MNRPDPVAAAQSAVREQFGTLGRKWLPRAELLTRLRVAQADPGLRDDLSRLAGETTDDLGSIQ